MTDTQYYDTLRKYEIITNFIPLQRVGEINEEFAEQEERKRQIQALKDELEDLIIEAEVEDFLRFGAGKNSDFDYN